MKPQLLLIMSMSIAVLADSSISEINQLDKSYSSPWMLDEDNILKFMDEIKQKQNKTLEVEKIIHILIHIIV